MIREMEPDAQRPPSSDEVLQGTEALQRLLDGFLGLREADQPRKAYKAPVRFSGSSRLDYLLGAA